MSFTPVPGQRVESYDLTRRLDPDFYAVFRDVPDADREAWDRAKTFVDEVIPVIDDYWDRAEYNLEFAHRMGELDLFADGIEHEGITHLTPLAAGLVNMEVSRGDGSMGTILAVQGGLALRTLALFGSDDQKERYLVPVARGEVLASFALTEPDHGSDSVSLETEAVRDGDEWVLNGAKKWIGNGASGGITFVWARVPTDDGRGTVRCFLVPQETPGYDGRPILGKASLRAIHQAHITLTDVRLPADAVLPGSRSFKDASTVLYATRSGVAWSALGSRDRVLRVRADVREGASAVRQAPRRVPDGAGAPHADARRAHRHAAVLPPPRRSRSRRVSCFRRRRRSRSTTTPAPRGGSPRSRATCSAATASCSSTASCGTWPTSSRSTPTRAPRACRRC